jgi:hypothetical protein
MAVGQRALAADTSMTAGPARKPLAADTRRHDHGVAGAVYSEGPPPAGRVR